MWIRVCASSMRDRNRLGNRGGTRTSGKRMDAIVLACAGLIRLGLESRITARLDPNTCLPAVTQGVIGIECRQSDASTR